MTIKTACYLGIMFVIITATYATAEQTYEAQGDQEKSDSMIRFPCSGHLEIGYDKYSLFKEKQVEDTDAVWYARIEPEAPLDEVFLKKNNLFIYNKGSHKLNYQVKILLDNGEKIERPAVFSYDVKNKKMERSSFQSIYFAQGISRQEAEKYRSDFGKFINAKCWAEKIVGVDGISLSAADVVEEIQEDELEGESFFSKVGRAVRILVLIGYLSFTGVIASRRNKNVLLNLFLALLLPIIWPIVLFFGKANPSNRSDASQSEKSFGSFSTLQKRRKICTWCGSKKITFLDGGVGEARWKHSNKDGSPDKRVKDNYQVASYISRWSCKQCGAETEYTHVADKNPGIKNEVIRGSCIKAGEGIRLAEDYENRNRRNSA